MSDKGTESRPRWYIESMDGALTDHMRDLLLHYSKIPSAELETHMYAVVSES